MSTNSSIGAAWFVLSMVMCVLSVVSKEQGFTVVAVCLTYDVFLVSKVCIFSKLSTSASNMEATPY